MFKWLRQRRRRTILSQPFPQDWEGILATNVRHSQFLDDAQRTLHRQLMQVFVAEKYWEGCDGFAMSDEVKVTIAAQACLLLLTMPHDCFDNVLSILVYPGEFSIRETDASSAGIRSERGELQLGEAVWRGPVLLSWSDVLAGTRGEDYGQNLVLHEFAHQVDMMNGRFADGIPPLNSRSELAAWQDAMKPEFERLMADCEAGRRGVIDCYGASNDAEFFAVVVEAFFEKSQMLQARHSAIYERLRDYFGLHPASWR